MNKAAALVFLHLVVTENIQNNQNVEISLTVGDLFRELNSNLNNMIEKLLKSLKIEQNTTTDKMKLLKLIHDTSQNVAENNFKIYNSIKNMSLVNPENESSTLFNLTTIIEEVFDVLQYDTEPTMDIIINEFEKNKAVFKTMNFIHNDGKSENLIEIMRCFIEKKDNNTIPHNINTSLKNRPLTTENSTCLKKKKSKRHHRKKHKNLKLWRSLSKSSEFISNITNRRIYKGNQVSGDRYPFITSIQVMGEFMCAGAIISRELIITAASCLQIVYNDHNLLNKPDYLTIRAGTELNKNEGLVFSVIEVHFHPMYDPLYLANNLAIARVMQEMVFEGSDIVMKRIQFDKSKTQLPKTARVTILGWGDKNGYARYSGPLTMARLEVYDINACKEVYSDDYVQDSNFCAGFVMEGSGACYKDAGGPGIVGNELVGVISFGPPICGTPDAPTVFTKLGFYSEWIDHVMKKIQKKLKKIAPSILLRQNLNQDVSTEKSKQTHPLDVMVLKQLFKYYILSGKMDIQDIMPRVYKDMHLKAEAVDYNEVFKIKNEILQNIQTTRHIKAKTKLKPEIESLTKNSITKSEFKYQSNVRHVTKKRHNNHFGNFKSKIEKNLELDITSDDDDKKNENGDSKSDSLSSNYETDSFTDEETDRGLSIEVEATKVTTRQTTTIRPKTTTVTTTNKHDDLLAKNSLREGTKYSRDKRFKLIHRTDPTTTKFTQSFNLGTTRVASSGSKSNWDKKIQDILLGPWGTEKTSPPPPEVRLQINIDDASKEDSSYEVDMEPDPNYYDTLK